MLDETTACQSWFVNALVYSVIHFRTNRPSACALVLNFYPRVGPFYASSLSGQTGRRRRYVFDLSVCSSATKLV